jgi:hypothetical protein
MNPFPSHDLRRARRDPHSRNNIRMRNLMRHLAIRLARSDEQRDPRLIMNTANIHECIVAAKEGVLQSLANPKRTSLRLGHLIWHRVESGLTTTVFAHASQLNYVETQEN